jgi:hypothetical protein
VVDLAAFQKTVISYVPAVRLSDLASMGLKYDERFYFYFLTLYLTTLSVSQLMCGYSIECD